MDMVPGMTGIRWRMGDALARGMVGAGAQVVLDST